MFDKESLRSFDLSDIDFENVGSWPLAVKAVACALLLAAVLGLGYYMHLEALQGQLAKAEKKEQQLKKQFTTKAFKAANLEVYRQQLSDMEEAFGALLRQLPTDTEVPGLLEDISATGIRSGLAFEAIQLQKEVKKQFYIELPIRIKAVGNYHDLATFVSGVASLPRIVTLHDFEIKSTKRGSFNQLSLNILAKTYRYNSGEEQK